MDTAGKKKSPRRRRRGKEKPYLPDEIITNILIKLPVKSLVQFQLVCKGWKDTILSRDFVDLHHTSSNPLLLVASRTCCGFDLFAYDKWWDLTRKRAVIHRFPSFAPHFSYASLNPFSHSGLIVGSCFSEPEPTSIILNPARPSDRFVKIKYSTYFWGEICAVYYHPSLEEYCVLWRICIHSNDIVHDPLVPLLIQFKVLNLGSHPSVKMISDAFPYKFKDQIHPLLINNHLYWMLDSKQDGHNDILEFDIITEEFMVIPCPIPLNTKCLCHQTQLLNSDGNLSFLLILSTSVTVWALKDRELQLWTSSEYTIDLDDCCIDSAARILAFVDGMLAYQSQERLWVCNLREGTVKRYPKKQGRLALFVSHQMSLASLNNCTSELYIDKDGKVFV